MKIGIHLTEGFYSERWIAYCESKGIEYKVVDCFRSDIIEQLADCGALMWHFSHKGPKATKFAKELLYSIEVTGRKVFPDFKTVWHFDDKLGQKYLFEAAGIPHAHAYAFYTKKEALEWAATTSYPKVFKLRNGSTSDNVKLAISKKEAIYFIRKAFGRGYRQYDFWYKLKERFRKYRMGKTTRWDVIKGVLRFFRTTEYDRVTGREKGYVYFQDFISGNDHDIRVWVVGNKAYAVKRMVRENDFRASGSFRIFYEKEHIRDEVIKTAFDIADNLQMQSLVMDFVFKEGKPLVVEISYGTPMEGYDDCTGHWDSNMNWHEGLFDFAGVMVEEVLAGIKERGE